MTNPWLNLPPLGSQSFVLPQDRPYVGYFNAVTKPNHVIVTAELPEPWMGPVLTGTVFILQQNPRFNPANPPMVVPAKHAVIGTLTTPNYFITSGNPWWLACFRSLAQDLGLRLLPGHPPAIQLTAGYSQIAARVCTFEYFPYGALNFGHSKLRLPSQDYSFALVRLGVARGVVCLVLKGWDEWAGAIPQLHGNPRAGKAIHTGFGVRYITPNTCPPGFYQTILQALQ